MREFKYLDDSVIGALELFEKKKIPVLKKLKFKRPLIIGSGNAVPTEKIIFDDYDAIFADESDYVHKIEKIKAIDGAVLISASGEKHAPIIAKELKRRGLKLILISCNNNASAKKFADNFILFPKNDEIYSYNVSTYLGMILSKTKENPKRIREFLRKSDKKINIGYGKYDSFFILVPNEFGLIKDMFVKKFGELFGARISVRVFTPEQAKHGELIVPYDKELFIGLGYRNKMFGKNRLNVEIPDGADYGFMLCLGYYIIGKIQRQNSNYFGENIERYAKNLPKSFG
jgi:hypothetical protein